MPPYAPILKLADLNGANGFRLDGVAANDLSGYSVSAAGDVNGDGLGDVIIGALSAGPGGNGGAGSSYVVFGRATGFGAALDLSTLSGANGFRLDGTAAGDSSGRSVSSAGDVNGDGFDDLIVGATYADPGGNTNAGSSYVIFGKASGFDSTIGLSTLGGANGFRIDGAVALDGSGFSVSSAGDVNGDGFDDIIIGANNADPNGIGNAGSSYVVFGKPAGFDPVVSLAGINGTNGFRLDGVAESDVSGFSVSSAGDFNGDGYDDIIVGANSADPGANDGAGSSYLVFGKAAGFDAAIALGALNDANGFRFDGVAAGDSSGSGVSSAGDINGDGFDDVIIGAPSADPGGIPSAGSSYVVFGKASGFGSSLNLANLNGTNGFRLDNTQSSNSGYSVSAAGDVNGDGFDDVIVGAYTASPGGVGIAGASYVVFGKASGFDAVISLANLTGADGFRMDGVAEDDRSSLSVSAAGDVNGDGLDDLIVGAHQADPGGNANAGSSYVVFGALPGISVTRIGSEIGQTIRGGAGDDRLEGLDGDDTLIANGGDDTLRGGADEDTLDGGAGDDALSGGSGNDALKGGLDNDALTGGSGNDTLTGGAGADTMDGGSGDDTYIDPTADDTLVEAPGTTSGGNDLVLSGATFSMAAFANVENLTLTGTGNFGATGNAGNNRITGNGGANTLVGGDGNDTLAGLGGADTLIGGAGNDIYVSPLNGTDTLVEAASVAGGLHDKIQTLISFNLSTVANVEDITLVGAANVNAIGNNLANILIGNPGTNTINGGGGADTITGGGGNDTMNGGAGADLFKFATTNTGADRIDGFEKTLDHFDLAGGLFSNRTELGGNTTLTHAGGTIVVTGVTGLSVTEWNALVVGGARAARADDTAPDALHATYRDHVPHTPLGHFGHADFL